MLFDGANAAGSGMPDYGTFTVQRNMGEAAKLIFHLTDEGRLVGVSSIGALTSIAKEVRIGEMLIEHLQSPDPKALVNPNLKLKSLLLRT